MVIENQYIQTNLMVALTLFEVIQGGPIYKSEADITRRLRFSVAQVFFGGANRHNLPQRICIEMVLSEILRVLFGYFGECRHKGA